jgi:phage FluMu protein Com
MNITAKATKPVRCKKCGRLLFKGKSWDVTIKCPKCGYIQTLNGQYKKKC